jgi:hypothetical protein
MQNAAALEAGASPKPAFFVKSSSGRQREIERVC